MAAAGLLAAVFLLFVYGMLALRIQAGGGYAPYSSFRSDPLGTRALHDALARMPGIQADRHQDQYSGLSGGAGETLFILGLDEWVLEQDDLQALEIFMSEGGRVVMAFQGRARIPFVMKYARKEKEKDKEKEEKKAPEGEAPKAEGEAEKEAKAPFPEGAGSGAPEGEAAPEKPGKPDNPPKEAPKRRDDHPWETMQKRWGFDFDYMPADMKLLSAGLEGDHPDMPKRVPWRSTMWFKETKPGWRTVYAVAEWPVVIERDFGRGQLLLLGDSYLFSNEALRQDRQTGFILAMAGADRHRIIFDEAHLGSIKQEGVMTLARRYRLTGFLLAALAAVGLFLWRSMSSLEPRLADGGDVDGAQAGLGAGAALTALLRRTVAVSSLPDTCWREWLRSFRGGLAGNDPRTAQVDAIVAVRPEGLHVARQTVEQYRAVAAALAERKVQRGARP